MNKLMKSALAIGLMAFVLGACGSDKDAEKRIAELENKLAQLETSKTGGATAATATPETKPEGPLPAFKFNELDHDFGTINEGDVVEHTFSFTNTGDAPLIIQSAKGSCGCTVPTWPKEPIPVGGTGEITAQFNSKGKPNIQNKTVTITANTWPKQSTLRIKAMVTPAAQQAPAEGPVK
ncbi:DUF1573 domain-containing protein [Fulvivirga lutimaris]|uniref:DUF1573 domain-containing protein n=1 Tax=Fulvivirga lutimaris TaxID=1819566 RepID=UPI001FE99ABD|nr:DUF1573 domain-containing protein [Fulvivirga lutimaris]